MLDAIYNYLSGGKLEKLRHENIMNRYFITKLRTDLSKCMSREEGLEERLDRIEALDVKSSIQGVLL